MDDPKTEKPMSAANTCERCKWWGSGSPVKSQVMRKCHNEHSMIFKARPTHWGCSRWQSREATGPEVQATRSGEPASKEEK